MPPSVLTASSVGTGSFGGPDHLLPTSDHCIAPPASLQIRSPRTREFVLDISFPRIETADDAALVSAIVHLANVVFIEAEAGIWIKGYQRTTAQEVANMLRNQQLALGYLTVDDPSADSYSNSLGQRLVACACVKTQSSSTTTTTTTTTSTSNTTNNTNGYISMLALDKQYWGHGMGRDMIVFAEQHCRELGCSTMVLDLLVPTTFKHPVKTRLQEWYLRMGYEMVRLADFGNQYPEYIPLLAGPVDFKVFEKKLC